VKELEAAGAPLEIMEENKRLKQQIEDLTTENSLLKEMKFTFDYPLNSAESNPALSLSPSSSSNTGSPFADSIFANDTASNANLFPSYDGISFDNPTFEKYMPLSPLSDFHQTSVQSITSQDIFSFNSTDIFSQPSNPEFNALLNSSDLFNQYRQSSNDPFLPSLATDNDIKDLLNTTGLEFPEPADQKNDCPLVDANLKAQVKRVVPDPAVLNDLCEMFSSKATCSEFIRLKEKVAIAIIKEQPQEVADLIRKARRIEEC